MGTVPRQLRIQYEGALYHLMNLGDRREAIFRDDLDRKRFLETLGATCQKTSWQVHAYCLVILKLNAILWSRSEILHRFGQLQVIDPKTAATNAW